MRREEKAVRPKVHQADFILTSISPLRFLLFPSTCQSSSVASPSAEQGDLSNVIYVHRRAHGSVLKEVVVLVGIHPQCQSIDDCVDIFLFTLIKSP